MDEPMRMLMMTHVDAAGIERARLIPRARIDAVLADGVHASISSAALFTPRDEPVDAVGLDAVIGDLLLKPDPSRRVLLDAQSGVGWMPADQFWPDGSPFFACGRDTVRRATAEVERRGLGVTVGFEVEFTLTTASGPGSARPAHTGPAYGQRPLLQNEDFVSALLESLEVAGLSILQLHAEHGLGQFELALGARDPLHACDDYVLTRLIIERTALRHDRIAHFSPVPPVGAASNGMHIHVSFDRDHHNLLSPARGGVPAGEGAAVVAGVLEILPAATALLAGSEPSFERLVPGRWSGASLCWGEGNREAAVRYVAGTASAGAAGANIEVKPGDATANPYLAMAAVLVGAMDGIDRSATPPAPVEISPAGMSAHDRRSRGIRPLPATLSEALDALGASETLRRGLGDRLVDLYIAVRMPRA